MGNDNYITPLWLTNALGRFDIDPCAAEDNACRHATRGYRLSASEDGLVMPWAGSRFWLNPPYSDPSPWMARATLHGNGIAVVNVGVSTKWWKNHVWGYASAVRFLGKRIRFWNSEGLEATRPEKESALVAWGAHNAGVLVGLGAHPDPRLAGRTWLLR